MARPIYCGRLLFAQAGAGPLVESKLDQREQAPLLTAYGMRNDAGQRAQRVRALRLHAPRVDDTTDATFGRAPVGAGGAWSASREEVLTVGNGVAVLDLPAASAALITFERE